MGRAALDEYLYLMDEAFGGDDWHSLMTNVKAVASDEWRWVAAGGVRPIGEMLSHVAGCKNMYQDHAFGPGTLTWADPRAALARRGAAHDHTSLHDDTVGGCGLGDGRRTASHEGRAA